MQRTLLNRSRRNLVTGLLLLALAFRAYVPIGFMPAAGHPFAVQLCNGSIPAPFAAHHHHQHSDSHAQFEHCPFGSAPATGPISHDATPALAGPVASAPIVRLAQLPPPARFDHTHQPRAPPRLA